MSYYRPPRFPIANKLKIAAAVVTIIVIIVIMAESIVIVDAGHRGVVLYLGAVENRVLGEGVHFIAPFLEQVVQMEVRTQKFQAEATAASNDLQEVQTVIALNYRIDPQEANKIYQTLGANYADRVISPTIQESVKASVAKFNAEELITKRETAKSVIANAISILLLLVHPFERLVDHLVRVVVGNGEAEDTRPVVRRVDHRAEVIDVRHDDLRTLPDPLVVRNDEADREAVRREERLRHVEP